MTALTDKQLLARARSLEPHFESITHCSRCLRCLAGARVHRRLYEFSGGALALAVLCRACDEAVPVGSRAEGKFRRGLAEGSLLHRPVGGAA